MSVLVNAFLLLIFYMYKINYFLLDLDECEVLDYTCDQLCTNKKGSFSCSCVPGYIKKNSTCEAINGAYKYKILKNNYEIN